MAAILPEPQCVYSLPRGRYVDNYRYVILQRDFMVGVLGISSGIALRWIPQGFPAGAVRQQTITWAMQCWSYDVTRPQLL